MFKMVIKLYLAMKEMLHEFKKENGIEGTINYVTGGLIPAGLQRPLIYNNILFVGDAGVGTFPVSGQGIYRALYSGELAGICIAAGKPKRYPYVVYHNFLYWDLIGKTFLRFNAVLNKISQRAVETFYNRYLGVWYTLH